MSTDGEVAFVAVGRAWQAMVDPSDLPLLETITWSAVTNGVGSVYAQSRRGYMHRLILDAPAGSEVDHINGDTLDNRRSNLRVATRSQNKANTSKPRRIGGSSSKYKGVSWSKTHRGWRAAIGVNRKTIYLGCFPTEEEAARVYDAAALEAWGEFARLNFPLEGAA